MIQTNAYYFSLACKDKYRSCDGWAKQGDCTSNGLAKWMKTNCPKVCGHCGDAKAKCTGLVDYFDACPEWAAAGDCKDTNQGWKKFMKRLCSLTCCNLK